MAEISPRGLLGSPCLVYKGVTMIRERCTVVDCVVRGVMSQLLSEVRGGIEAHGGMLWGCVLWV